MCDVVIDSGFEQQNMPIPTLPLNKTALRNNQTDGARMYTIPTPTYFFSHLPINFFSTRKIRSPPNRSGEYSS